MAVGTITSNRTETIVYSGDIAQTVTFAAAANAQSPGGNDIYTLSAGNNTITLPTGGSTPKAATIVPPSGNANTITLKGVAGDTGIGISKLDPTTITFDTPPVSFVLSAGGIITGLRIVWS